MTELTVGCRIYFTKALEEKRLCVSVSFIFVYFFLSSFELPNIMLSDIFISKMSYVADTEFPPHCSSL